MSKKVGIVFFSKDGSTKVLANLLAKKHDGEVIELIEKSKRNKMLSFIIKGYQASKKKEVELVGESYKKIDEFDKIYLCTPIWANNGTPAINAFLNNVDLSGKQIVILTVKGYTPTEKIKKCHDYLEKIVADKNGKVVSSIDVHGASIGKTATIEHIEEQITAFDI